MTDDLTRSEARAAWREQAFDSAQPAVRVLGSWIAGTIAAVTVGLITARLLEVVPGLGAVAVGLLGAAIASTLLALPLVAQLRGRRTIRGWVERAREADAEAHCPRCEAPLLARGAQCSGARACGACGAALLEADGLLIVDHRDPTWRQRRWRGAAMARLASVRAPRVVTPGAVALIPATIGSLYVLVASAGLAGARVGAPASAETTLVPSPPEEGRAFAEPEGEETLPMGTPTRPAAPMWLGTQVLARRGGAGHFAFGAIVNANEERAFVVFADGESAWVERDVLLAPELAAGDRIEVFDGARFVGATLRERMGEALRIQRDDGVSTWTSVARVRVRGDGRHVRGEGLEGRVPPGAWVEVGVDGGAWRPGLVVDGRAEPVRVALSDGSEGSVERARIRAQHIGPGVEVWVDGWREPVLVARRVGHALAVVDARGRRSWTALGRVRRRIPA